MKIYNLTDVPTPQLTQRGLLSQTFAVYGSEIAPGAMVEFTDNAETDALVKAETKHLVAFGALVYDELPESYLKAKVKPPASTTPSTPQSKAAAKKAVETAPPPMSVESPEKKKET